MRVPVNPMLAMLQIVAANGPSDHFVTFQADTLADKVTIGFPNEGRMVDGKPVG